MSEIGHNSSHREAARQAAQELVNTRTPRRDEFVAAIQAKTVTDREKAGDGVDLISLAKKFANTVEDERKAITDPYREAAEAGKGVVDDFMVPLEEAMTALRARIDEWDAGEQSRIEAQRREQEEALRQMRQAPRATAKEIAEHLTSSPSEAVPDLKPARTRPVRGDLGGKMHQADVVTWTVDDVSLIPRHILETETVKRAICQVAKDNDKHTKSIPGMTRTVDKTNRIR